jgi:hypothetical protein
MAQAALGLHEGLWSSTRLPSLVAPGQRISGREWAALLLAGAGAALAACFLDLGLRLPGHAILRSVFPMALGLALVPRQGAGLVMGAGALLTAGGLRLAGLGPGAGALTSLLLIGPCLDLALWNASAGWRVYLRFALAGLAANLAALAVRGGLKLVGVDVGSRPWEAWWPVAIGTYALFGIIAGLVSAVAWFRLGPNREAA